MTEQYELNDSQLFRLQQMIDREWKRRQIENRVTAEVVKHFEVDNAVINLIEYAVEVLAEMPGA